MKKIKFKFRSSIYGQVVLTITILSIILFVSFGIIFRSVNDDYLNKVIQQNGNNMGSIVEGALYHSMLTNDRKDLENTLDVINTLPGIEDVNLYDKSNNLVYSPYQDDRTGGSNPHCLQCHPDLHNMFPEKEKSFRIISMETNCAMSPKPYDSRLLLIRSPILNDKSCSTAACHAHPETEPILGSFVIRIPLNDLDTAVTASTKNFFLLATITTLLLVLFLMIFVRRKIKTPLDDIVLASEAVSGGDRNMRLEIRPDHVPDMKKVASAFNKMLDNLQSASEEIENWSQQLEYKVQKKSAELSEIQNELIHVERIASLGKLSSSVAHEINNPLLGVLTYSKLVHKQLDKLSLAESQKAPMLKYLKIIEDETKRCGDIVKGLLDFSRKDQLDFRNVMLHHILKETYTLMNHQMKMANITFFTDYGAEKDLVYCNENQVKQACIAILMNAMEAISENGEIVIRTSNRNEESITLEVIDNGIGIDQDDIPHIFEPFFSAKNKATGIGLGLSIVHGIVQTHKGQINIRSGPGEGTTVAITFPLVKQDGKTA